MKKRALLMFSWLLITGMLVLVAPAEAAVFTVNTCTEAAFVIEFNNAITNPGADVVNFACGGVIPITTELNVTDDLTIEANGNAVTFDGGGTTRFFTMTAGASFTVNGLRFTNGSASDGGAIDNTAGGTLTFNRAVFSSNNASNDGGAVVNGGVMTVNGSRFENNTASSFGGAVDNFGTLNVNNTTFSNNSAFYGGSILSGGSIVMRGVTFSGGVAQEDGGAIYGFGTMTIDNSTCYNNRALDSGGCVYLTGGSTNFTHVTMDSNTAASGAGALAIQAGSFTLTNSIVTSDCSGTIVDGGSNIAFGAAGCPGATVNPLLRPYGNYGGGTATLPLSAGSPAINAAADCAGLAVDQLGHPRPQGGACDIGSVEIMIDPVTGQVIEVAIPGTPPLNEWNAEYQEETRAHAFGIPDDVYGTVHMEDGAWQYNAGGVPQELIDYGVLLAVDVWIQRPDGQTQFEFGGYQRICLQGIGRMIFMDATESPRTMTEILPVDIEGGYTCGWIPNAGTVILIRREEG